jgi:hypothetical protein
MSPKSVVQLYSAIVSSDVTEKGKDSVQPGSTWWVVSIPKPDFIQYRDRETSHFFSQPGQ